MNLEGVDYKYALKCIYNAHAADVRAVKPTSIPEGGILTGSRDNSVKVWAPEGKSFKECQVFSGATSFIASLCVLPPSAQYPKGLFLAGSNDCSIYGFTPDSSEPVLKLLGHSGPVCALSCGNFGYFVSGSWDKTARVWSGQQCILTLHGHLETVWATDVFSTQNLILTGSADHTIRLWRSGVCEKIFTGHNDCVRGLAIISDKKFLSCSNDGTVRLWLTSGECVEVFRSNSDYIYSIALLGNGIDFVSCGEDQNIKIWRNGTCVQTFVISPKSLWSVACLSNGDIAVGTSDGKVYVLEKVPFDYFEKVSELGSVAPKLEEASGVQDDTLMTEEVPDVQSSVYDGETFVFYENQSNYMYVCQYNHSSGIKIRKETFDFQYIFNTFFKRSEKAQAAITGQESLQDKDYVFDVDVEDDVYKLAMNKGENPWLVASRFAAQHDLPNDHVSQIVDYIIKNTTSTFTNEFFPAKSYLTYLNINQVGLRAKLIEFCELVPKEKRMTVPEIDELMLLAYFPSIVSNEQMASLDKAISWNDEFLFPVLDLLRVGVKCQGLVEKISSREFVNHLLHIFMTTRKSVNRVLIEKIFCNMFGIDKAESVLVYYQDKILESVKEIFSTGEKSVQKAGCSLLLNFAVASYNGFDLIVERYCMHVVEILTYITDHDAIIRALIAVGTVCTRSTLAVTYFRSVNIKESILKFTERNDNLKICRIGALLCADF